MSGCFQQVTTYLFNIIEDPHEVNNVADQHPGMVRELTGMLEAARSEGRPFPHNSDKALVESSSCEGFRNNNHGFLGSFMEWIHPSTPSPDQSHQTMSGPMTSPASQQSRARPGAAHQQPQQQQQQQQAPTKVPTLEELATAAQQELQQLQQRKPELPQGLMPQQQEQQELQQQQQAQQQAQQQEQAQHQQAQAQQQAMQFVS